MAELKGLMSCIAFVRDEAICCRYVHYYFVFILFITVNLFLRFKITCKCYLKFKISLECIYLLTKVQRFCFSVVIVIKWLNLII